MSATATGEMAQWLSVYWSCRWPQTSSLLPPVTPAVGDPLPLASWAPALICTLTPHMYISNNVVFSEGKYHYPPWRGKKTEAHRGTCLFPRSRAGAEAQTQAVWPPFYSLLCVEFHLQNAAHPSLVSGHWHFPHLAITHSCPSLKNKWIQLGVWSLELQKEA